MNIRKHVPYIARLDRERNEARRERDLARAAAQAADLQRVEAIAQRDEAMRQQREAQNQRDHAFRQRDGATGEKDEAFRQRDAAVDREKEAQKQRDEAYRQRDEALRQQDDAVRQNQEAQAHRAEALGQRDSAVVQRDEAYRARDSALAESERLKQELGIHELNSSYINLCPTPEMQKSVLKFLADLKPSRVEGHRKVRCGREFDGGYTMLDDFEDSRNAISIGIGDDMSWDRDIAARNVVVHQFDHSVAEPLERNGNLRFVRKKVVATASPAADEISLDEILDSDELKGDSNLILKMDIEGDEWEILERLDARHLLRIKQLVIEFHFMERFVEEPWRKRAFSVLAKLRQEHTNIHVHGNNHVGFIVIGNVPVPRVFEVTFVRSGGYRFHSGAVRVPEKIDRPNRPTEADLFFGLP